MHRTSEIQLGAVEAAVQVPEGVACVQEIIEELTQVLEVFVPAAQGLEVSEAAALEAEGAAQVTEGTAQLEVTKGVAQEQGVAVQISK